MTEYMMFELADGTRVNALTNIAHREVIRDVVRDVYELDFLPDDYEIDELRSIFSDPDKTASISQVCVDGEGVEYLAEASEHFTLYRGISETVREVRAEPGKVQPPIEQTVYVVRLAQKSYGEIEQEKAQQQLEEARQQLSSAQDQLSEMTVMIKKAEAK